MLGFACHLFARGSSDSVISGVKHWPLSTCEHLVCLLENWALRVLALCEIWEIYWKQCSHRSLSRYWSYHCDSTSQELTNSDPMLTLIHSAQDRGKYSSWSAPPISSVALSLVQSLTSRAVSESGNLVARNGPRYFCTPDTCESQPITNLNAVEKLTSCLQQRHCCSS